MMRRTFPGLVAASLLTVPVAVEAQPLKKEGDYE
jgi:hypothetical protein